MLGTCLRNLVVFLSLVAVAAFAGHGTAMARVASHDHPASHVQSPASTHDAGDHQGKDGSPSMSCCGKSCTSLLPFPAPSGIAREAVVDDPDAALHTQIAGILPPGPKRPPKLA